MRFLKHGPAIPDELLVARDEGQVLFFCGAGVSRAKAGLPSFLELAERVLKKLGALPDSPARRLTEIAARLQKEPITGVGGILAADRIFGLLERDFALADIEWAVAQALKPGEGISLDAHKMLLDLSRGPSGKAQLVTTNFDLLFEAAGPGLTAWTPNDLPDLRRQGHFEGIVHLHGMLDSEYRRAVGGQLVLSSSEFGRAYLAEGWATEFIRSAIARYRIVFVGYTADDPPVQYLLEALNRVNDSKKQGLYAFQEGRESEAAALWRQKGVNAIAYSPEGDHQELWETLSAWAERARDPNRWRTRLISRARRGPATLKPHERGQVAHLAATVEGARALSEAKRPIASEWLCVFDPSIRFGTPGKADFNNYAAPNVDPFDRYGIDSDTEPARERDENHFKRREVPKGALDVLGPLPLDGVAEYTAGLRGGRGSTAAQIPPRLISMAVWLMRICGEPAAMWWAAGQGSLHPVLLRNIRFALDNRQGKFTPLARTFWRYLFETWHWSRDNEIVDGYALNQRIAKEGWTPASRRAFAEHFRPALSAERPFSVLPPVESRKPNQSQVVSLRVHYAENHIEIQIPDAEIGSVLPLLRHNLLQAGALEKELRSYDLLIPPIEPDPNLPGESSDRDWGPNPQILRFADLFRKLLELDRPLAVVEFAAWPQNDDPIFARLRIWAAGLGGLLNPEEAGAVFVQASDRVFWGDRDQRDLLVALARRWNGLGKDVRRKLETRLRRGLPRKRHYDPSLYPKWKALSIAERFAWLKAQNCQFDFDVDSVIAREQAKIPDWKADGLHAADSMEGRGGAVHTDTSFAELENVPIEKLVEAALATRERQFGSLERQDPYAGLVNARPLRVLAALRRLQQPNALTERGWSQFLQSAGRLKDKPGLVATIARRLLLLPPPLLASLLSPIAHWLDQSATRLFEIDAETARTIFDQLLGMIANEPERDRRTSSPTNERRNWFEMAWNSVVRDLVDLLMADPELNSIPLCGGLPATWTRRAEALRQLPGDLGRFALTQMSRHLSWFYASDPQWTERVLLSAIEAGGDDRDALLSGFFSNAQIQGKEFFDRLKPTLLAIAIGGEYPREQRESSIASLFITGWRVQTDTGERFVSDDELRTVIVHGSDAMRTHMIWHVNKWEIGEKLTLLRDVWPLQLAARSAAVSGRLCSMIFDDEENFAALADAIVRFLSPIENHDIYLAFRLDKHDEIFSRYPHKILDLLWKVLPERPQNWPYSSGDVLSRLLKASPEIAKDARYAELRRRQARAT